MTATINKPTRATEITVTTINHILTYFIIAEIVYHSQKPLKSSKGL